MTKTNDERILELKKQIEDKKESLGKALKFTPVTNCSIELDGIRYNINATSKSDLVHLMVKLQSYLTSAKTLDVAEEYEISGYSPVDWIEDIQSKLDIMNRKNEEQKLKQMESKLTQLLSERKKVELEIDEIESFLKD